MEHSQQDLLAEMDFNSFKRKVKLAYGLDLNAYKRPQMERRLRANMDRCGAKTFQQYYTFMQKDATLAEDFLDRVTINVSELFRNPDQFEVLRTKVLPVLLEEKRGLSCWSAGCSYGAEPYTLSVLLNELSPTGRHSILATDIDDKMLARAQRGVFADYEMKNVSSARMSKYFQAVSEGYEAKSLIKNTIRFSKHNLLESNFSTGFDLIICRNVVIYFTDETKAILYKKFFQSLRPGGYLFVGGTERITSYSETGYESIFPFFYRKPKLS